MPLLSASNPIGMPFIELQSIDSTNKYAMTIVHQNQLPDGQGEPQHGMAIFSHEQTAGKGQRGKVWTSEKDANIALSILLNPYPLSITEQFRLSICIAVSVADFFMKYAGDETKIKWPNDLYWRDRKAGGILIENIIRNNEWKWAIAGIGININQTSFDPKLPNPVSLKQITGKKINTLEAAKEICKEIEMNFQLLINNHFEKLYNKYLNLLYKKDESVRFRRNNRLFDAIIKGVTPAGELIISHSIEEKILLGEIEWIVTSTKK